MENAKIIILLVGLFLAVAIPVAIAVIDIWSAPVEVTVVDEYTITITDPLDGTMSDTYTFTGVLKKNGVAEVGATVELFIDSGGGFVTTGLTDTTDGSGAYSITWTPSVAGTFTFKTFA